MTYSKQQGRSHLISLVVVVAAVGLLIYAYTESGKLRPAKVVVVEGFPDISDLAWLQDRQTFIAVSDEGLIGEVNLVGEVLQLRELPGYDLESVTTLPERSDQVLVMDECGGRLLLFSVPELEILKEKKLPDEALVADSCNKQIEGMALQGEDRIVLANEGPARLIFFDDSLMEYKKSVSIDTQYISEVIELFNGSLLVISRDAGLRLYSSVGEALGPWHPVSHGFIEGGEFVPEEGLVLCVDRAPSKLLFFPQLQDDDSVLQKLRYLADD